MIKHIVICDKCGAQEDMVLAPDSNYKYCIPDDWKQFGICPKYLLCPHCANELQCQIESFIYKYVEGEKSDECN